MPKAEYEFKIGTIRAEHGTSTNPVIVTGWVVNGRDHDRPLRMDVSPADARRLAARLIEAAETSERAEVTTACLADMESNPGWPHEPGTEAAKRQAEAYERERANVQPAPTMTYSEHCGHVLGVAPQYDKDHVVPCAQCGSETHTACQHGDEDRHCSRCGIDHTPEECVYKV
ncbi:MULTISPECIES: hypothetical protein [unclassified Kitasatospora]|uniref:hypothetical protein n=1 Tax=unclassified Kitasatospora TaxID=2633591 RepID=UPI002472EE3F|nr:MULTISPECIES: hypothetical protein [unclassified Kitasatospora]MDH6123849.1 hypothetical protein [Kitasatospora sp. GP82]MDH6576052.1 hypothetical protein [Kitasatospora sp. MAP5-34]